MTLGPFGQYTTTAIPAPDTLADLILSLHNDLLGMIGSLVNFGLPNVKDDVDHWLGWMLEGGSRPKPTMRTAYANGTNGYCITQDAVCSVLQRHAHLLGWNDPAHFKLIERATRPSPGTEPLGPPPK